MRASHPRKLPALPRAKGVGAGLPVLPALPAAGPISGCPLFQDRPSIVLTHSRPSWGQPAYFEQARLSAGFCGRVPAKQETRFGGFRRLREQIQM